MSVPIPLWNRNVGNIAASQARQEQAEAAFAVSRREVERKTAEAAAIYAAKVEELSRWEVNTIDRIREAAGVCGFALSIRRDPADHLR